MPIVDVVMRQTTDFPALERSQLEIVLDALAEGTVIGSPSGVNVNAAARAILAYPENEPFELERLNPRTLDGEPFAFPTAGYFPGKYALETAKSAGIQNILALRGGKAWIL